MICLLECRDGARRERVHDLCDRTRGQRGWGHHDGHVQPARREYGRDVQWERAAERGREGRVWRPGRERTDVVGVHAA